MEEKGEGVEGEKLLASQVLEELDDLSVARRSL